MDDDDFSSISGDSIPGVVDIRVKKTTKARCPPNNSGGGNYSLRNFEKAVQIKVKCADLFQKITAELVQLNAEFFTHAKPEDALVKIVLSGLPVFEVDDLIEELEKNDIFPREVKVLSKSEGGNRALYLLNFLKGSVKLTQLREVKTIFNVVVWWRFYTRNKTDVMQCFRCQGFGHGSRYCNMTPRCVKCGQKHGSNECQLPTKAELEKAPDDVRQKIRCANCNLNHTANFKECTARKDYLKHQEKKKPRKASPQAEKASPSPRKFTSNVVAPGLSFANIAAGPALAPHPVQLPMTICFQLPSSWAWREKCTPRLHKVLERIVLARMNRHLDNNRIVPDEQFGFRRAHSTNHQLVRIAQAVKKGFDSKKSTGMLMLDVESL
ncbi:hypothetical protein quinque_000626 [Culex quinquefasciatus]